MNLPMTSYELWLPVFLNAIIIISLLIIYVVSYMKDKKKIVLKQEAVKRFYGDSVPLIVAGIQFFITIGLTLNTMYLS